MKFTDPSGEPLFEPDYSQAAPSVLGAQENLDQDIAAARGQVTETAGQSGLAGAGIHDPKREQGEASKSLPEQNSLSVNAVLERERAWLDGHSDSGASREIYDRLLAGTLPVAGDTREELIRKARSLHDAELKEHTTVFQHAHRTMVSLEGIAQTVSDIRRKINQAREDDVPVSLDTLSARLDEITEYLGSASSAHKEQSASIFTRENSILREEGRPSVSYRPPFEQ